MIEKFDKPVEIMDSEIDEKYDGKYVAYQRTSEMFGEGQCYVVAIGDKNDENFDSLFEYVRKLSKENGIPGSVRVGNKNRGTEELYVVFSDVR